MEPEQGLWPFSEKEEILAKVELRAEEDREEGVTVE